MNAETIEISKRHRLAEVCREALLLAVQLSKISEYGDAISLRQNILQMLERLERRGKQGGISLEEIQSAKFAIVAFLDETILNSRWSQKDSWMGKTLAFELFNRVDAGEEFFRRLEELRRHSTANVDLLEVYYLCLALGFKGKYKIYEPERLRFLIEELSGEIRTALNISSIALSPWGKPREPVSAVIGGVPPWIIIAGAAAIGLIFYIIMLFISNSEAGRI